MADVKRSSNREAGRSGGRDAKGAAYVVHVYGLRDVCARTYS